MPTFSDKDFFGDPLWPQDFTADHKKLQASELLVHSSAKKSSQNPDPNQNSCHSVSFPSDQPDLEDMEKVFLINEQKMLYSNLKHSEITYLEDHHKAFEVSKDDLQSSEKLSESPINQNSHDRNLKKQAQIKFESEYFDLPGLSQDSSESQSYMIDDQEFEEPQIKRPKRRPTDLIYAPYNLRGHKIKKEHQQEQNQPLKIEQIIKQCINGVNGIEKIRKMEEIQCQILRKLQGEVDPLEQLIKMQYNVLKRNQKKVKTQKYKILTEAEKEYLVYLSTLTTTCEVARRFNISVNNICRWKKGTKRKAGAGRKIVNQELEGKVIGYVREKIEKGQVLSRRQIQIKAKELSGDTSFKASKGWFERFYNRNIDIFMEHPKLRMRHKND